MAVVVISACGGDDNHFVDNLSTYAPSMAHSRHFSLFCQDTGEGIAAVYGDAAGTLATVKVTIDLITQEDTFHIEPRFGEIDHFHERIRVGRG